MLLRIAVAGLLGRRALRGLARLLRRAGDLPLGAAAQRVLVRVEVLDLRLFVAVAGRAQLVLPGVRVLGSALSGAPGCPGGTGGMTAVGSGAPVLGSTAVGSAAPAGPEVCGRTLVAPFGS